MNKLNTKDMTQIALFTTIIIISSWLNVTIFSFIPFTLQTSAIFLCLLTLNKKNSLYCILLYIIMGCIGLPVFSGFKGGAQALFGPTGGFIIGFIIMGLINFITYNKNHKLYLRFIIMLISLCALYFFGVVWFVNVYTKSPITLIEAYNICVAPFIIFDISKLLLACLTTNRISKLIIK